MPRSAKARSMRLQKRVKSSYTCAEKYAELLRRTKFSSPLSSLPKNTLL